ncbi:MAG: sulfite reductase, ferredoxin dependent, partial [Cyanobacteria bacterium]|nr:sulfite reductase, ferredoxin dependent [Cyanobacteriota bacterium]
MTLTPDRQVKSSGSGSTTLETDAVDAASRSSPPANGSAIKPPSKFERLKASSDYLKEPLATELENDKPFFTDGAVQILKF